jgi:cell division protein FtsZ
MGIGVGHGDNRAADAANGAIDNPLLEETTIEGATKLLVNITGGEDLSLVEVEEVMNIIRGKAHPDVYIIHGVRDDADLEGGIRVTVIATGFQTDKVKKPGNTGAEGVTSQSGDFIPIEIWERWPNSRQPKPSSRNAYSEEEDLEIPAVIRKFNYMADNRLSGKASEG